MTAEFDTPETRAALAENYSLYAQGLDSKDWALVRRCFADQVSIDYGTISDPTGSPDVPRNTQDWLQVLQSVINGFDITRHTITNHRTAFVDGLVSCRAYLIADHVIFSNPELPLVADDDVATVVGEYTNHYERTAEGWKICRSKLEIQYSRGNLALFVTAAERVAEQLREQG
jgi:hypothetical protein